MQLSANAWTILSCPHCNGALTKSDGDAHCVQCQTVYPHTQSGGLDFRLQRKKTYEFGFHLNEPLCHDGVDLSPLSFKPEPDVDYSEIKAPHHLSKEIMSYFPRGQTEASLMLDLGCGAAINESVAEAAGFEYISIDYSSTVALILGDAHSLPFKENSFEFVLALATLAHLRYPFVAVAEAYRVLKPGGRLIGTVAFLEPFNHDSFYHHTHLGTLNVLQSAGFEVSHIAPHIGWSVLEAPRHWLYPKMPAILPRLLLYPAKAVHKLWWRVGFHGKRENERALIFSGAFTFIADKPSDR